MVFFVFYDTFLSLCEDKGVSPSALLVDLGISKGSLGRWKAGGNPANPTKKKIADYFGITVRELMSPPTEKENHLDDEAEVLTARERILLTMYRSVPKDQRKTLLAMIEAVLKSQGLL